jgi:hypothetical protein
MKIMKVNRLDAHDRYEHFTKQSFNITDCCQDIINKQPFGTERASGISSNVAHTPSKQNRGLFESKLQSNIRASSEDMANSGCECERGEKKPKWPSLHFAGCRRFWETEPAVGRMADGCEFRVDTLRALGNSCVPAQAKKAFEILMGIKNPSQELEG